MTILLWVLGYLLVSVPLAVLVGRYLKTMEERA